MEERGGVGIRMSWLEKFQKPISGRTPIRYQRVITLITDVLADVSLTNFTLAVYEDIASLNVNIFSLSCNFAPVWSEVKQNTKINNLPKISRM